MVEHTGSLPPAAPRHPPFPEVAESESASPVPPEARFAREDWPELFAGVVIVLGFTFARVALGLGLDASLLAGVVLGVVAMITDRPLPWIAGASVALWWVGSL